MDFLLVLLGVAFLYLGGEGLVRGAVGIGKRLALSPLVVGLTIVSIGTSSPELAASLAGVLEGLPAIALGNVVGSNIANLGLVLGLTALVWPLGVARHFLRRDVPFMISMSALMAVLAWNGRVGRLEGLLLLAMLVAYMAYLVRRERESLAITAELEDGLGRPFHAAGLAALSVLAGIGALVLGAHFLVQGAVGVARAFEVSERVIGLTMVAFGTSLPELASSLVAALRHEPDIALGNLIGSNVFNILLILGTTAVVRPLQVAAGEVWIDLGVMLAVSLLVWLFLASGSRLSRLEGAVLVSSYTLYVVYLFV